MAPTVVLAEPVKIDPVAESLRAFYARDGAAPLWTESSERRKRAGQLLDWLDGAIVHGLSPQRYGAAQLRARLETAPDDPQLDRDLSEAFLRHSVELIGGAVDPVELETRVHVDPERPDPFGLLQNAASAGDLPKLLAGLAPQLPRYTAMQSRIAQMIETAQRGGWGPTVGASSLMPGEVSTNVAALRRRLIAIGDLPPEPDMMISGEAAVYDERLQSAVAAFQRRHGLDADGIAGPATLRALNRPIEARIAQAMLNLERLRWRAKRLTGRRIEVNQADFRMAVYDSFGRVAHDARVIVGQRERRLQTPEFYDHLSFLVLNPTWTVPKSIIWREILPEMQKDPSYLKRNNKILLRGGEAVDPATVDWDSLTRETVEPYAVVQKPGPGNALGNVKFMFPNGFNVYLHDTPQKHLFDSGRRAFSHGCVRVERPFALAWYLLAEQNDDPGKLIEDILATEKETPVPLDRPIPIHLMYLTAWVDGDGVLQFRDDVYGRDSVLAAALHASEEEAAPGL